MLGLGMRSGLIDDTCDMKTKSTSDSIDLSQRKSSLWAGISYLITFLSLLLAYFYISVRDKSFVTTSGSDAAVIFGGVLEIIVALAGIASAVALYPVVKRQSQGSQYYVHRSYVFAGGNNLAAT